MKKYAGLIIFIIFISLIIMTKYFFIKLINPENKASSMHSLKAEQIDKPGTSQPGATPVSSSLPGLPTPDLRQIDGRQGTHV